MTQATTVRLSATLLVASLSCAGAAAQGQTGPTALTPAGVPTGLAIVADSVVGGDRTSSFWTFPAPGGGEAIFFVVTEIDGKRVESSLEASHRASHGMGARMRVVDVERPVRPGKVRIRLLGTVAMAAPIDAIFKSGRLFSAEGETEVELKADVRYRVNGIVDSLRREVWIEEVQTGRVVGKKISQSPDPEAARKMETAAHYACCNLRYDDRWISDSNILARPFIPAGSRVKIEDWGRNRVHVLVEGRPLSAGPDNGFEKLTREQFAERLFVKDDPRPRFAAWPPEVQAAIVEGKVMRGMTREQVVMSIGTPRADLTGDLKGTRWVYTATTESDDFDIDFDDAGTVREINASSRVKRLVVHSPEAR
jgi:hypothetical protein